MSVIHEKHSQLVLKIPEVHFGTDDTIETPNESTTSEGTAAKPIRTSVVRTLRVSSLSALIGSLTSPEVRPTEAYEESDSSSEDEAAQMAMSQSIVSLKSSASMYHSAVSLPPMTSSSNVPIDDPYSTSTVLSSKDPIVIQVISHPSASYRPNTTPKPKINIQVSIGVLACALEAWQVRCLIDCATFIPDPPPPVPKPSIPRQPSIRDTLHASIQLRALVVLLLQPAGSTPTQQIDDFFSRPLMPFTKQQHVRLQLDHLNASVSKELKLEDSLLELVSETTASIHDAFVMYLRPSQSSPNTTVFPHNQSSAPSDSNDGIISPIFIFDSNLSPATARSSTTVFPFLDITNEWDKRGSMLRPSVWRVRVPPKKESATQPTTPSNVGDKDAISFRKGSVGELRLNPFHIFVDLDMVSAFLVPFLDGMSPKDIAENTSDVPDIDDEDVLSQHGEEAIMETPRPRVLELDREDDNSKEPVSCHTTRHLLLPVDF